jgi:putative Mg2+ transporter-C (MgtC) family protein
MESTARLVVATVIGLIIGLEREFRDKPAGLRTMMLISIGAAIFAMVSERMGGPHGDRARIAAQIVTGVGFLGAGVILRTANAVYGLTTAAAIWVTAALGMTCGFGDLPLAFAGAAATLVVLIAMHFITSRVDDLRHVSRFKITTADRDMEIKEIEQLFEQGGLKIIAHRCHEDGERLVFNLRAIGSTQNHSLIRQQIIRREDLRLVR